MIETMARYDSSHDKYHVERVRKTALAIAKQVSPSPDLFIVEMAALLHDVVDKKYVPAQVSADPYSFFQPYFTSWAKEYGVDLNEDGRGRTIVRVMDNVSWSTEKKLRESSQWTEWHDTCVELHCTQDADRLDAIGALGILRCAAYTSAVNKPLYTSTEDPERPFTVIQHFHDKLLKICTQLKTQPGKKMGAKRHQVVRISP
ncbi:hypothetical protein CPB83DRAFT_782498 [Crepidotus variabilis]|uniref:HD/PDEase domain-containing protein n=1 Tax=Crepidotus variabilis TaxID=179855 RepID=A0A9P6JVX7_9AGAR|nr:hypothetical protein CPB83DRAFT_782498 [Crepidotus variabilis]